MTRPDVCIVGVGAAGGIAAWLLAEAGLQVVGLEAGPAWTADDFHPDELESAHRRNAMGAKYLAETPTWRPNEGTPARPVRFTTPMMNGVGGASIHYAGLSWRSHPFDFALRSRIVARYGEDALPKDSAVVDWPLTYFDLEPYYDRVEYALGVAGRAGNLRGRLRPGGNPFEGPRERDYPLPPLRPCVVGELARQAAEGLGYHPFPCPAAINTRPYGGRGACTYCGFCNGYGCPVDAKNGTHLTTIPQALATGRFTLRTGCRVIRLNTDGQGRVTSVDYLDPSGAMQRQEAALFILSSFTLENVRLLLLSKGEEFPQGLANNHGQVGRSFTCHAGCGVTGVVEGQQLNRFAGPWAQGITIDDFNADNFDHTGLGFVVGGCIMFRNQQHPIEASGMVPPGVPRWGRGYKEFLLRNSNSLVPVSVMPDVLTYHDNYLDLDPDRRDPLGFPVVRVTFRYHENEERLAGFLQDRAEGVLREMGAGVVWRNELRSRAVLGGHLVGGTRMGNDPATSVVDPYGRAHEAANLVLCSGSTMPSVTGFNPTQTFQALTWRTCDHILATWRHGAGPG